MALSPNGKMLATVSHEDHKLRLWNPDTMESLAELEADGNLEGTFYSVAFSEDGRWLVAWYSNPNYGIHIWDCGVSPPRRSAYGRAGGGTGLVRVVCGDRPLVLASHRNAGGLELWAPSADSVHFRGAADSKMKQTDRLAVAPGGKLIAVAGGSELGLWEMSDGKLTQVADLKGHDRIIYLAEFSGDGKLLVSADDGRTVRIWRVDGGKTKEVSKFTAGKALHSLTCDRSGKRLALGNEGGFTIYALEEGVAKETYFTPVPYANVSAIAFGTAEQGLFVGDNWGIIQRYQLGPDKATPLGDPPVRANGNYSNLSSRVARTGRIAVWHPDNVAIWDPTGAGYKLRANVPIVLSKDSWYAIYSMGLSCDGNFLAALIQGSPAQLELWDLRGEKPVRTDKYALRDVGLLEWLPDGKTIATGNTDVIQLLRQENGKFKPGSRVAAPGWGIPTRCSRDGGTLAAGKLPWPMHKLCLWSLKTGEPTEIGQLGVPDGWAQGVALSPDGKSVAIGGYGTTPKLFDFSTKVPRETAMSQATIAQCLCFSPDGKYLAGANRISGNITIWDVATGKAKRDIPSSAGRILELVYAEDGRHLFLFNGNGTIFVLRLAPA